MKDIYNKSIRKLSLGWINNPLERPIPGEIDDTKFEDILCMKSSKLMVMKGDNLIPVEVSSCHKLIIYTMI